MRLSVILFSTYASPLFSDVFTHMSGPYPKKGESYPWLRDMCYKECKPEATVGIFTIWDIGLLLSPIKTFLTSRMLPSWMWILLKGNIRQILMYSWYLHFWNYYLKSDLIKYEKCIKKVYFCALNHIVHLLNFYSKYLLKIFFWTAPCHSVITLMYSQSGWQVCWVYTTDKDFKNKILRVLSKGNCMA